MNNPYAACREFFAMDSAPKDGTDILIQMPDGEVFRSKWIADVSWHMIDADGGWLNYHDRSDREAFGIFRTAPIAWAPTP